MRQDAIELEKIRHDLGALRVEIEQCEQEEAEESGTVNITSDHNAFSEHNNHRYDPFAVDSSTT